MSTSIGGPPDPDRADPQGTPRTDPAPAGASRDGTEVFAPVADPYADERRAVVERERERFGGMRFFTAFFGWLTAAGMVVLLSAIAAGVAALLGQGRVVGTAEGAGIVAAVVLGAIVLIAYFCGGYVAGRMARFSGLRQGLAVFIWAVLIALVLAVAGVVLGAQTNAFAQLQGVVPALPLTGDQLTTGGIVSAVVLLALILIGSLLGGLAGMRYHRRVDRYGVHGE